MGAQDSTFHVGPYLGHVTKRSVSVGWESVASGDTKVEYGDDASYGQMAEGAPGTMHLVVVEGLVPGTTYHYRACTGGACTRDLMFSTAPEPGQPTSFTVYGDCQDNPDTHAAVIDGVINDAPNLMFVVGDLVGDGSFREQYKERFFDPARRAAHYLPRYAAVGNHDRKDEEVVAFRDYLMFPEDPEVPQPETSYAFVYGDAFYLVLDNTLDHYDLFFPLGTSEPPLYAWLKKQLASPAARKARWRFAFAHYPPDSNCREDGYSPGLPETAVRNYLLPMLWDAGFHAYFAGHIHCYERFDFDGHLVITTGGGGGGVDAQELCDDGLAEARTQRCVHHHVTVNMGCEEAEVSATAIDGTVLERIRLNRDGTHALLE